jgi:putative CocE/NonD family hydrolase
MRHSYSGAETEEYGVAVRPRGGKSAPEKIHYGEEHMTMKVSKISLTLALALSSVALHAQGIPVVVPGGDIPKAYTPIAAETDFERREVKIPMRDGVKLHTIILVPKGAANAPILMDRTPYNATARSTRSTSGKMINALPFENEEFVRNGYIIVWQDTRGKFKSDGEYTMIMPAAGPLNPTGVDHSTDAYDTIAWLVDKANLPEANGRVGMIGSSYEGYTTASALLNPHPALRAAAPESPIIDGWMGDDWFHHGAFRQLMLGFVAMQSGDKAFAATPPHGSGDDYHIFREAGSTGDWARARGFDQLPAWKRIVANPEYNQTWSGQALDKLLAANPSDVPTLWVQPFWDQEDSYGAITAFEALRKAGKTGNNHIILGPWFHSQINRSAGGRSTGAFNWSSDTVADYWKKMILPFFNQHLKDGPPANMPVATAYNTGEDKWEKLKAWPLACESGCPAPLTPIYLAAESGLAFKPGAAGEDSYVSDPAKPVPFLPRPFSMQKSVYTPEWPVWLVSDQRHADGRPDVMTYTTEVLTEPVRVSGAPIAEIIARTTGTDGDFVVKVIDVFPQENESNPKMAGYELPISLDIFRGRYRNSFARPTAIPKGKTQTYKFRLPTVNHVFQPGHRIMVQIQSSLFPLYDRNPQTFVPNIFNAKKGDYRAATVTLERGAAGTRIWLPIVPVDQSAMIAE